MGGRTQGLPGVPTLLELSPKRLKGSPSSSLVLLTASSSREPAGSRRNRTAACRFAAARRFASHARRSETRFTTATIELRRSSEASS